MTGFDFNSLWDYRWAFVQGLVTTIGLSLASIVAGGLVALPLTAGLLSRSAVVRWPINVMVQTTRAVPLLVQLLAAYYTVPSTFGIRPTSLVTAWVVFSVYFSCFVADALRSATLAVPRSYREAGLSVGMTAAQVRWRIVAPEVFRRALPALSALSISLIKYTSIASAIQVSELAYTAEVFVVQKLRPFEAYGLVALLFVLIVVPCGLFSRWLESRWSVSPRTEVTP